MHYYLHVHLQAVCDADPDCAFSFLLLQQIRFPQFMERELQSEYCLTEFATHPVCAELAFPLLC